jgi:hypothetical protein
VRRPDVKIRELITILSMMAPEAEAFVALFNADGMSETFDIEDVTDNNGDAQIEIYDEEPAV